MQVLITGAGGKVGSRLIAELSEDNCDVVGFDAVARPSGMDCRWVSGDLSDQHKLDEAMKGCDSVVHLAAIPKHIDGLEVETCRVNFFGTVCVLDQAVRHQVKRVIAASSICASGLITSKGARRPEVLPITEDFNGGADDMYGMSKRFGEYLADAYERRYGLSMINLRIASVSFPDDAPYDEFMSTVFAPENDSSAFMKDIRWQYVDVRDVVQAIRLVLASPTAIGIYNVGAADTPGSDWRLWHKGSFPELSMASVSASLRDNPSAPLWSIDRIATELGYSPKHSWREYPVFTQGVEACRARFK